MKLRHLIAAFPVLLFAFSVSAQFLSNDKLLKLEQHPSDDSKFIAKFYDKDSRILIEYWEMSSNVDEIDASNFNELLKKRLIFANGKNYFLYENRKKQIVANYEQGKKIGEFSGFYETGELRFKGNYNKVPDGKFLHFYKDGNIRKEENFENGIANGKTIFYYKTGQAFLEYNYAHGIKDGFSTIFYPDGKEKRRLKYKMDKLVSEKCFDNSGNKTECTPLIAAPSFVGGTEALKTEIEKIDFSFNNIPIDTLECRLTIIIDTLGNPRLKELYFQSNKLKNKNISDWVENSPQFIPMLFDNKPCESIINLAFPVCQNKVLWLGEMSQSQNTLKDYKTQIQSEVFYWELPNPANNEIFFIVDNMPKFPGGEEALRSFIAKTVRYPLGAQKKGIGGKVYITFVINQLGKPTDIKVAKSVYSTLDEAAKRVVSQMPDWQPGSFKGRPVSVSYTVPINFIYRGRTNSHPYIR